VRNTIIVAAIVAVLLGALLAFLLSPGEESAGPPVPGRQASAPDAAKTSTGKPAEPAAEKPAVPKMAAPDSAKDPTLPSRKAPARVAAAPSTAKPQQREKPAEPAAKPAKTAEPAAQPAKATEPAAQPKTAAKPPAPEETKIAAIPKQPAPPKVAAPSKAAPMPAPEPALAPPSFDIVRIAKEGTAVLAGRAPPGAKVRVHLGQAVIAEVTASGRGEWVAVIDQPLPSGAIELSLSALLPDGRVVESDAVLAAVVPGRPGAPVPGKEKGSDTALALLLPKKGDVPSKLLQKPEPQGGATDKSLSVDKVDYDEKGNVVISGNAPAGATVRTYLDNKPTGETKAGRERQWQLKPGRNVAPGSYKLRVDQLNRAGRVVARIELPFYRTAAAEVLAATAVSHRVIVQPGNSLWRIARRVYGSGPHYTVIYRANDGQIRDPDLIYPGQVFNLPAESKTMVR
jgi:hypothetical protein